MKLLEEWQLDSTWIGRRVLLYDCVDSTNDLAASLAQNDANHGVVILAQQQRSGRGQHGRTWSAPPQSAVLMSALLFPPGTLRRPVILTAWCAVAVCRAIQELTQCTSRIKWPNDVLINGKKTCGILIEQGRGIVAGIGLNVAQDQETLDRLGLPDATSLQIVSDRAIRVEETTRSLIRHLDREWDRLVQGQTTGLESEWRERLGIMGRQVTARRSDGAAEGRLVNLTFEEVELQTAAGIRVRLVPEIIKHLTPL